ncbi:MAG: restriction endonuclease subunit S [Oscillospiraceae bacterium]|nr:restriction endonuclease subunit S [Oscillospiraceae bacterium]
MAKLSEICTINMGQSPESTTYNENGEGLPFFQGNADFSKIHPNVRVWCNAPKKIAHKNDILISVRAPIGALNVADSDCCIGRGLASLSVNNSVSVAEYIWYALESKVDYLISMGTGSTFKAIGKNILFDLDIPLPPLETQRQIAANLDKVTHTIDLCNAILEKLDLLVKSRFVEMFGEPVYNTKHFTTKHGIDIFKLSNGKPVPEEKRMEDGIPAFGGNGISWYTDDVLYNKDTLVIGRVGFQSGNVHYAKAPLWVTDNAMYISEMIDNNFDLTFLCDLMEHIDFTRYQDAGDLKKITQKPFMNMEFIVPPLELQKRYVSFVEQTDKSKLAVKQVIEKAETLKKALMQEYFG